MHYIFALAIQLFLMFKTGTAGQVSKQDEYICFISIFLGVVSFDRQASINPVAEPFQNHSDTFKRREAVTGIDVISRYYSWNRPGAVLPQSWCTLPGQLLPKAYERMTHLKWQQIKKKKTFFFPKEKMKETSNTSFLKTEWWKWKESLYLFSVHGFPEIQRTLPVWGRCGPWRCAFAKSNLKDDQAPSSCFHWHSNAKLLMCQPSGLKWLPHLQERGNQPTWGWGKAWKPPFWKSGSIHTKGELPAAVSLHRGCLPVWRCTLTYPNGDGAVWLSSKAWATCHLWRITGLFPSSTNSNPATGTGGGRAELCSLENSRSALVNDFNEYIHCLNANIAAEVVSETIFCFPLMLFPFICYQIG